jgi:hypothetical protein
MINIKVKDANVSFGPEFNTKLLKPKATLFQKFWKNNTLNSLVSRKLMEIADKVIESLNLTDEVEDVIITGSIASYNWHELSDIDLHIMLDFEKIDDNFDLVKRMLDQTRINWNKKHNILIAGKEVELYFQHYTEPHEANGIWSLELEKWLVNPARLNPELDMQTTEKKAEAIAQQIEHAYEMFKDKKYKQTYEYSGKIKEKIARMRTSGLSKEGIFSPENLAFKMLRNAGYLEKLSTVKVESYDKMMSLNLENKSINETQAWKNYLQQGGE